MNNTKDIHTPLRPKQMKRADLFLLLIEERCQPRSRDEMEYGRFWKPGERWGAEKIERIDHEIIVGGGADMAAINSLVRKGLIEEVRTTRTAGNVRLGWRITDKGKLRAQELA